MAFILPTLSTAAIFSVLLLCIFKFVIYPAFISPLSKIPNAHLTAPVFPCWILWNRFRMRGNKTIHEAHEKHGPIVRLSPSEISINCVDGGIRTVYAGGFEKHDWYPRVFGAYGTISMFSMVGSKRHSVRKRMLSNIYSKSYLQVSPHLAAISRTLIYERLLPMIHENADSGSAIDVHDLNNAITMDFVTAYIFGRKAGTDFLRDADTRKPWLESYQSRKPFEFYHQEVPNLTELAKKLNIPLIPAWCQKANEDMEAWGLQLCDKAEEYMASTDPDSEPLVYKQLKKSMIKQLRTKEDQQISGSISDSIRLDIACELYDQLTAGFETSAVTLTYLYWEMSKLPDLQLELRKELETLSPKIAFPRMSDIAQAELPSPKSIDSLPILNALLMETLRLHGPIPGIQPRITPSPPTTLAGYFNIPPGTRVNAQGYSLHRNPDVFPEPETFRPQRWLIPNNSVEMEQMKRWFWAFGSGGRMCVGSNLAFQEMKLVVAALYSNFTTEIVDDEGIEAIDAYTIRPESNRLILRFKHL
ncbi:hypothetical protein AJ80_03768 [Polytolypa hystricis UAMH7299]|uniref:Cytochrome P450 monooxygenase n=1 Tax=Polytolypa hystricis (strain UAMH7299) TaxID=1447883 RepID=A0A2B7YFN8_POLH7|nr:hypothetical protein AJ80_03768 [Polytolypa hystricis UAMH7299]